MVRPATIAFAVAASVGLKWSQAARMVMKGRAEPDEAETKVAAAPPAPAAPLDEPRDFENTQDCIDSIRLDGGAGSVKFNFIATDGEVNADDLDRDTLAAGCFFELALEAFNSAYDEDEEKDAEISLQGSSIRSQVSKNTLMYMLKFAHGKLAEAEFVAKDVSFSQIQWPVKSDLTLNNVSRKDADFIESVAKDGKIFSLVIATHFLNFKELYRLATAKVSALTFGKTKEQIKEILSQQS